MFVRTGHVSQYVGYAVRTIACVHVGMSYWVLYRVYTGCDDECAWHRERLVGQICRKGACMVHTCCRLLKNSFCRARHAPNIACAIHAAADITAFYLALFPSQHHHCQQQYEQDTCGRHPAGSRLTVDDLVRCQQPGAAVRLTATDLRLYFYTIDYCL